MGRQDRAFRDFDEDRQAGVPANGAERARLHQLALSHCRPRHPAGSRARRNAVTRAQGASADAAADRLRPRPVRRRRCDTVSAPAMPRITRDSLMTLEAYAKARKDFRAKVMAHKKRRAVHLGEHLTLLFEDELTIRYQVQEILRVEKSFEEQAIQDELDAYNPLVPDGHNWKATLLVEYEDVEERKQALAKLKGVEDRVWVQVGSLPRVYAIADEDLERENDEKTSAVHFVRFELTRSMVSELRRGSALSIGVDHPAYTFTLHQVPEPTRRALLDDLSGA